MIFLIKTTEKIRLLTHNSEVRFDFGDFVQWWEKKVIIFSNEFFKSCLASIL